MRAYFNNFWEGFVECTDGINVSFFIQLFKKVFKEDCIIGTVENADILCESIFGVSTLTPETCDRFRYKFLFSGESHALPANKNLYDVILCGERNHENIINCPLFVPYIYCQNMKSSLENKVDRVSPPKKNKILCTIGNPGGFDRNKILDVLEKNFEIDYAGGYKKNTFSCVSTTRYWSKEYIDFMSDYKFVISMENSRQDTYITEKIINPLYANTIPIYWGSLRIADYFNNERIINISDSSNLNDSIQKIKELMEDDKKYLKVVNSNTFTDNNFWRNIEDVVVDIESRLNKSLGVIDKVFIICSSKYEPSRYENMINLMRRLSVSNDKYKIYSKIYKNEISESDMQKYVKKKMCELLPWVGPYRNLKKAELSLFLNYYDIFNEIDKRYLDGIFLTLESDVLETPEIYTYFESFLQVIKNNSDKWSCISLGYGGEDDRFVKGDIKKWENTKEFFFLRQKITRCTDSLIWTRKGIEKILEYMKFEDYSEPFDHYMCRMMEIEESFKFFWSEPHYFKQQSNYGNDTSTIQHDRY